jgi:enoyl-CoA hydratase/carnithine racemase
MLYNTLIYQKKGNVAVCKIADTLDEKDRVVEFSQELAALCEKVFADADIRVMVLTGDKDRFFSMGMDLIEELTCGSEALPHSLPSVAGSVAKIDIPVIAAINGDANGLGLELALACDIRVAAKTAGFGFPHIKNGVIPWDGGTQRLSRLVGKAKAMEMILTGDMIDSKEAFCAGLVSKVVEPSELMQTVSDMADKIALKGPFALKYAKEAVNKGMDLTLNQGLSLEADLYFLLHTTKDRTEGIKAFQEKRNPVFEGR